MRPHQGKARCGKPRNARIRASRGKFQATRRLLACHGDGPRNRLGCRRGRLQRPSLRFEYRRLSPVVAALLHGFLGGDSALIGWDGHSGTLRPGKDFANGTMASSSTTGSPSTGKNQGVMPAVVPIPRKHTTSPDKALEPWLIDGKLPLSPSSKPTNGSPKERDFPSPV